MTIGVIARIVVQEGKGAEFEAGFTAFAQQVRANEPGNIVYHLIRSRTEPNVYKVFEIYKDQESLTSHDTSDYFKAAEPSLRAVLAGRPELEYLDGVG